jgi:hypothetical protein
MANIFADSAIGGGANNGATTDDAYQTAAALTLTYAGSNRVWIRRRSSFALGANMVLGASSAVPNAYTEFIAWPRPDRAFTGTWVQGERVVSGVAVLTPSLLAHAGRYAKNDTDGKFYLITAIAVKITFGSITQAFAKYETITDGTSGAIGKIMRWDGSGNVAWVVVQSGTFGTNAITGDGKVQEGVAKTAGAGTASAVATDGYVLLNDYIGTGEISGASTIQKDYYYDYAQANLVGVVDSGWTVKLGSGGWDDDPDTIPKVDGSTNAYYTQLNGDYQTVRNAHFDGGGGTGYGGLHMRDFGQIAHGCIITSQNNIVGISNITTCNGALEACIVVGMGPTNTSNHGIGFEGKMKLRDCAVYGCGGYGANMTIGDCEVHNCNFGVELDDTNYDWQSQNSRNNFRDCQFGGKNGVFRTSVADSPNPFASVGNHQRVLGEIVRKIHNGILTRVATGADPGTPPSSAAKIFKLMMNGNAGTIATVPEWDILCGEAFAQNLYLTAGSKTIRYYIQNNGFGNVNTSDAPNAAQFWFEVEGLFTRISDSLYLPSQNATYPWMPPRSTSSANPIPDRGNADDWDDYIEATVTIPVAGVYRVKFYARIFDADGVLYIDDVEVT